ncbi:MAG: ribonuclease J [Patescibacteria group bacterium]
METDRLDKWIGKITGAQKTRTPRRRHSKKDHKVQKLRIIPLGGLDEVGKNMTVFEYGDDIIVVDMGFQFPEEDMLGVDYVIPDISYLEGKKKNIRAVIITHGHMDHIGGIPYILPKLGMPKVFATKLTRGLIERRLDEFELTKMANLNTINPEETLRFGPFTLNFFRVAHSIPDGVGISIDTPHGRIIHTGDFKFDPEPAGSTQRTDIRKLQKLCQKPILALLSDSTNSLSPGTTISEKEVGRNLEDIIRKTPKRLIIASFSSLIGRIQQIIDYAQKYKRTVFVSGRSMIENMAIAEKLGYLKIPKRLVFDIRRTKKHPGNDSIILTTGSQGEAVSALTRIAMSEHPHVKLKEGDTVILSSSPIIGNERAIFTVINNLCMLGARVIHSAIMDVHTSGHAKQDDLTRMIKLVKPKYLVPIHGEYFMRKGHAELGSRMGIKNENILLIQNGDVLEIFAGKVEKSQEKVETNYIVIDGLGEGDVDSLVISDRQKMAENGVLIILLTVDGKTKKLLQKPSIISRGFVYLKESQEVEKEVGVKAERAYRNIIEKKKGVKRGEIKKYVRGSVEKYTHQKLERKPLIIPVIDEV